MAIIGEQELKDGVIKLRSVASREEVGRWAGGLRERESMAFWQAMPNQDPSKSLALMLVPTWKAPKGSPLTMVVVG